MISSNGESSQQLDPHLQGTRTFTSHIPEEHTGEYNMSDEYSKERLHNDSQVLAQEQFIESP